MPPHHTKDIYEKYAGDKEIMLFEGDHNSPRSFQFQNKAYIFLYNALQCDTLFTEENRIYKFGNARKPKNVGSGPGVKIHQPQIRKDEAMEMSPELEPREDGSEAQFLEVAVRGSVKGLSPAKMFKDKNPFEEEKKGASHKVALPEDFDSFDPDMKKAILESI